MVRIFQTRLGICSMGQAIFRLVLPGYYRGFSMNLSAQYSFENRSLRPTIRRRIRLCLPALVVFALCFEWSANAQENQYNSVSTTSQPAQILEAGLIKAPALNSLMTAPTNPLPKSNAFNKPYGYHLTPILNHIHANNDQRTKITSIVQSYRSKIEPLRVLYKQKSQDFLNSVTSGLSSDLILNKQLQLGQLYANITSQYCLMSLEVRRLLKPDQIVLYEEYKQHQGWSHQ